jgi:hypothetical protein
MVFVKALDGKRKKAGKKKNKRDVYITSIAPAGF